jgi:hypothetical protein
MRLSPRKSSKISRRVGAKSHWLLLALGIVAIGFQSFIVLPHFHIQEAGSLGAMSEHALEDQGLGHEGPANDPVQDKTPGDTDQLACSMCQSAHHNGHYIKPVSTTSFSPATEVWRTEPGFELVSGTAKFFSHQTRAPPHA